MILQDTRLVIEIMFSTYKQQKKPDISKEYNKKNTHEYRKVHNDASTDIRLVIEIMF